MKKIILATTALVATAGVASADISLNAAANFGIVYDGLLDTTTVQNELDFGISAKGESDNGVSFGASLDLDVDHVNSANVGGTVADPEAFISFGGLTLTVGDVGEAGDVSNLDDIGFSELGVDNDAEGHAHGSHDVFIGYKMDAVALNLSADSSNDDFGIGVSGSFAGFDVALGYSDTAGVNTTTLALGYSMGDVAVDVMVADGAYQSYGFDVVYSMNALTLTLAMGNDDRAGAEADYGIGVGYDLGGGLSLQGGVANVNGDSYADFGVVMSF